MFNLFFIASFIIIIPAVIAVLRYPVMDETFKPLAYNLWIGLFAEVLGYIGRITIKNNLYVFNIFMYLDFVTFLWLFFNWGAFKNLHRKIITWAFIFFTVLWVFDNLVLHDPGGKNFIFRICYSLVLLLIAIDQMNQVVIKSSHSLKFNPYLYIILGIIFYYSYSIFISLFNSPLFHPSAQLWKWNMLIYVIINVGTNLLFAISLLWMRKKMKFI